MSYRSTLSRSSFIIMALAAAAGLAACDSDTDNVSPPVAAAITADATHNNQTGTVGLVLADSIQVHVTTASGAAISGTTVTWTVATGAGTVNPTTSVTNVNGDARTSWTLGATAGANTVTASIPSGATATLTATGTAAP
jgi:hypothetical protein